MMVHFLVLILTIKILLENQLIARLKMFAANNEKILLDLAANQLKSQQC